MTAPAPASSSYPILLSTQVVVPNGGGVVTADADDLQNDHQRDIQIEEIRFFVFVNSNMAVGGNPSSVETNPAARVRVKLKMGRFDLTNNFIPLWLLGPRLVSVPGNIIGGDSGFDGLPGFYNAAGNGTETVWDYQRWRFPRPLIVRHGSTLMAQFQVLQPDGSTVQGARSNTSYTVYIALVGRTFDREVPKKIPVPYATAWIADAVTQGLQSGDDQLVNKFNVDLHLQRFIGRVASELTGGLWYDGGDGGTAAPFSLTLNDSSGYQIVETTTDWSDVFNQARKTLNASGVLGPRQWYKARISQAALPLGGPGSVPMISLIGWREEEL